jgi:ribosomal subunit interface protein
MRIMVTGEDLNITNQFRAYTEYRFFAGIARYEPLIRSVNVTIRQITRIRDTFVCLAVVDLWGGTQIKSQARCHNPHAAIDRAVNKVASLLSRRVPRHVSS